MQLEQFVVDYGYLAILAGTFLEGEMILVLAGFLAHCGYMELPWVMAAAFAGSFSGDQLIYHVGRLRGSRLLARRPAWQARAERVFGLLRRHQNLVALGFRFCYGFRTITPFAIGMSGVRPGRFLLLNGIGAALWAAAIATLGYLLGATATALITEVKRYERFVLAGLVLAMLVVWLVLRWRDRQRESQERAAAPRPQDWP
jgi:membrane protein DedA with SNARE-associated domain